MSYKLKNNELPESMKGGECKGVDRDVGQSLRTINDRIIELMNERSIRRTASLWGIPTSTLTNYLYKQSMIPLDKAMQIAKAENVSVEWIATGVVPDSPKSTVEANALESSANKGRSTLMEDWISLCKDFDDDELRQLKRIIIKRGVKGILLSERAHSIGLIAEQLNDDALKEISILLNYAQYCALTDQEFKVSNLVNNLNKATG